MTQAPAEYGALPQANPYHPAPTVRAAYVMHSIDAAGREGPPLEFAPGTTPAHLADALGVRAVEYTRFVGSGETSDLGQYDANTDRIQILRPEERTHPWMTGAEHSLLHEIAHAHGAPDRDGRTNELLALQAADLARGMPSGEMSPETRRLYLREEVTAEATAAMLAQRLGLETRSFSASYITAHISQAGVKLSPDDLDRAVHDASRAAHDIHGAYLEYSRHPERVLSTDIAARDRLDQDTDRLRGLQGSADALEIRGSELQRLARSLGEGEAEAKRAARIFAEPDVVLQKVRQAPDFAAQERYLQDVTEGRAAEAKLVPAREPGLTGMIGGKTERAARAALPETLSTLREYGTTVRAARQSLQNARETGKEELRDLPPAERQRLEALKLPARTQELAGLVRKQADALSAHTGRAEASVPSRAEIGMRLSALTPAQQASLRQQHPQIGSASPEGPKLSHAAAPGRSW